MDWAFIAATMARRGLLTPGRPDRIVRQFASLGRWGFGLAGELRQAASRSPDRVAVIDDERTVTYTELLDRAGRLARALPVKPGERVGLLCRNSARMIEALIGVTILGADPVLVNTGLSAHQLDAVGREQELSALIHDDEFTDRVGMLDCTLDERRVEQLIAAAPDGPPAPPGRPGRTIVLTSGTTGVPKGARRPTPGGFRPLCSVIDRIPLRAGDRIMIAAPLFHTWGFAGMQIALALRATIVLRRRFDPADTRTALAEHRVDGLVAVPVMVRQLMDLEPGGEPRTLRVAAVSGSALPGGLATRFMDRYGDVLYNLYGSTEASWVSIATPADLRADPATAGRPPYGTRVVVLGDDDRPAPPGVTGRIFVGNEMLFEGYTGDRPASEMVEGLLGIGDVGHFDADGRLFVDGRADDMIVSGGENVFPAEVEDLLAALPQVREVAVIGVPDPEWGQRLAAYLVVSPGGQLDAEAVREHVRRHRARFCVPRDVVFLGELPRNATGKVLTRELPRSAPG
ncbi:AMP-binding protein [Actinoplanes sp. NPDC049802]|uniref:AMP-binding protein n=1 Tax=Actinoplanes sp. NPDC049802 TaxID=3154742 RepID=UPI0033FA887C